VTRWLSRALGSIGALAVVGACTVPAILLTPQTPAEITCGIDPVDCGGGYCCPNDNECGGQPNGPFVATCPSGECCLSPLVVSGHMRAPR
jgi:hypothetical protein